MAHISIRLGSEIGSQGGRFQIGLFVYSNRILLCISLLVEKCARVQQKKIHSVCNIVAAVVGITSNTHCCSLIIANRVAFVGLTGAVSNMDMVVFRQPMYTRWKDAKGTIILLFTHFARTSFIFLCRIINSAGANRKKNEVKEGKERARRKIFNDTGSIVAFTCSTFLHHSSFCRND